MKRIHCNLAITLLLVLAAAGYGFTGSVYQGTYVDAVESNTAAVGGTSPWNSGTADTAGLWKLRDTFGNGTNLWEANGNASYLGDCPELVTTVSGLLPGFDYDMYLVIWIPNGQNVRIRAGVSAGDLTEYNNSNTTRTGGVDADRYEYQVLIGTARASASGQAKVYVDDIASTYRSWYDGVEYKAKGVSTPTPVDKAVDIAGGQNQTLSWAMPTDPNFPSLPNAVITKHYFYIRKNDPNLVGVAKQDVSVTSNPASQSTTVFVDNNAVYYWRVDESINNSGPADGNTISGTVWSFTTTRTLPSFNPPYGTQPVNVIVSENTDAVLTATAGTSGGVGGTIIYQWYKGASGVTTNPVSDAIGHISGAATSQLTIKAQASDVGSYWCQATNSNGTGNSNAATINVKRKIAWYKFESDLNDSAGTNNGTMGSPTYTTGIDGQALVFDGSQVVTLSTSAYPNAGDGGAIAAGTVSFWMKSLTTATYNFSGTANSTDGTLFYCGFTASNGMFMNLRNSASTQITLSYAPASNLRNDQWHLITWVWDAAVAQIVLYIDGRQVSTATAAAISGFTAWQYPMMLGAENVSGTATGIFTGAMDDYRVYNYTLSAAEVAQIYVDFVSGVTICPVLPTYDFNSDCKTNTADLLMFAAGWLDCNIIPDSSCQ